MVDVVVLLGTLRLVQFLIITLLVVHWLVRFCSSSGVQGPKE